MISTFHGFDFDFDTGAANYRSRDEYAAGEAWCHLMSDWLSAQSFDTIAAIWATDQMLGTAFCEQPDTPVQRRLNAAQARAAKKATKGWLNPDGFQYPAICARPRVEE